MVASAYEVNPPNKSHVATIVFDKFGSKAWPLFGVSFIRSEKFGAKAWPFPPLLLLLTTISPPRPSGGRGVLIKARIAENFRAEGAKKKLTPFFGHFWYIYGPNFFLITLIEAALRIRAHAGATP